MDSWLSSVNYFDINSLNPYSWDQRSLWSNDKYWKIKGSIWHIWIEYWANLIVDISFIWFSKIRSSIWNFNQWAYQIKLWLKLQLFLQFRQLRELIENNLWINIWTQLERHGKWLFQIGTIRSNHPNTWSKDFIRIILMIIVLDNAD